MSKTRVLIVEDEGIIAVKTKLVLMSNGFEVLPIAISGASAIEIAEAEKPDLVLMDIKLRGKMDGIDTARTIKTFSAAPVIYMTAHADATTLGRARETGPADILIKPVEDYDLIDAITRAL